MKESRTRGTNGQVWSSRRAPTTSVRAERVRAIALLVFLGLLLTMPLELMWGATWRVAVTTGAVGLFVVVVLAVLAQWLDGPTNR